MLQSEYLVAKIGVDTAENGPLKVSKNSQQLEKKSKHFKTNIEVTGPDGAYVQGAPRKEPYYGGGDDGEEDYY